LLLAEGLSRLEPLAPLGGRWLRIESAKFLQPVAPGAAVTATLSIATGDQGSVEFRVAGALVARATLTTAGAAGHQAQA
jgi:hypothetical protein